ncbi:hypothetical protein [Amycolatopsis sp. DSM 110486]|uniref:hypothetical protein n=1 Tax=Amycolatopsis sp. DSM 110486 TaxID=2865832 RepID=UPI001C6A4CA4|nr:hypothetical protein [Amycolatopsis sp. DSM 110486]QYN24714.1 hypothetical protein K1T34_21120 [Amycolatopsis sp. DSM 110486]
MAEKDDNTAEPAGLTSDDLAKPEPASNEAEQGEKVEEQAKELPTGFPPAPPVASYPGYMQNAEEPAKAKAPGPVQAAFILTIVASVVLLIGQVVTIFFKQQLVDQAVKATAPGRKLDMAQLESNATTLVWALFVGALCYSIIMVLFAYKAREGTRSARSVVTMLALLGLVFQLGLVRSVFSVVSSLLLVILVALLYVPSTSRDYFPKVGKKL